MSDLLKRLRAAGDDYTVAWGSGELYDEAADELERLTRELEEARKGAAMVADIAHSGGMAGHSESSALTAIRRLTLRAWNPHGKTDEHRERVKEAGYEAVRRSGA